MTGPEVELSSDGTCVLRDGDVERWRVSPDLGHAATWNPFREAILWLTANLVVAAAGDRVHFLDLDTGKRRTTHDLTPDCFGYLALVELTDEDPVRDLLLVLGWTDARAYHADGTLRWHVRNLAVDGLVFVEHRGSILELHAEMDPPGGWFAVSLDLSTGRELDRQPAFLPGYVGLYGQGPDPSS